MWNKSNVIENASTVETQLGQFAGIDDFEAVTVTYDQQKVSNTENKFLILQFVSDTGAKYRVMAATFIREAKNIPDLLKRTKQSDKITINKTMKLMISSSKNKVTVVPVTQDEVVEQVDA